MTADRTPLPVVRDALLAYLRGEADDLPWAAIRRLHLVVPDGEELGGAACRYRCVIDAALDFDDEMVALAAVRLIEELEEVEHDPLEHLLDPHRSDCPNHRSRRPEYACGCAGRAT